jgi:hypothetical protein
MICVGVLTVVLEKIYYLGIARYQYFVGRAAVHRRVVYKDEDDRTTEIPYLSMLKVHVATDDGDPFGIVKRGIVTIRAKFLIPTTAWPDSKHGYGQISIDKKSIRGRILWDYEDCSGQTFMFLPVGIVSYRNKEYIAGLFRDTSIDGLLLKKFATEKGRYERVGKFEDRKSEKAKSVEEKFRDQKLELQEARQSAQVPTETDYILVDIDEDGIKWYTISII